MASATKSYRGGRANPEARARVLLVAPRLFNTVEQMRAPAFDLPGRAEQSLVCFRKRRPRRAAAAAAATASPSPGIIAVSSLLLLLGRVWVLTERRRIVELKSTGGLTRITERGNRTRVSSVQGRSAWRRDEGSCNCKSRPFRTSLIMNFASSRKFESFPARVQGCFEKVLRSGIGSLW